MSIEQYIQIVDHFGRLVRPDKRGSIPKDLAPILKRLNIDPVELRAIIADIPTIFRRFLGNEECIKQRASEVGRKWFHGIGAARRVFLQEQTTPAEDDGSSTEQ